MARQNITLTPDSAGRTWCNFEATPAQTRKLIIKPGLMKDPTVVGFFVALNFQYFADHLFRFQLFLTEFINPQTGSDPETSDLEGDSQSGPDMSLKWAQRLNDAVTVTHVATGTSFSMGGPDSGGNLRDANEPYNSFTNVPSDWPTFLAAVRAAIDAGTDASCTISFFDGVEDVVNAELEFDTESGTPSASVPLVVDPPSELEFSVETGAPESTVELTVDAPPDIELEIAGQAGTPEAAFPITEIVPEYFEGQEATVNAKNNNRARIIFRAAPKLSPFWFPEGSDSQWLSEIRVFASGALQLRVIAIAGSATGTIQEITAQVRSEILITLTNGNNTVSVRGVGADFEDNWTPDNSSDVTTFFNSLSRGDTVTVDFVRAVARVEFSAHPGVPEADFEIRESYTGIEFLAKTEVPEATVPLSVNAPGDVHIEFSAESGTPETELPLRKIDPPDPVQLEFEAESEIPTAFMEIDTATKEIVGDNLYAITAQHSTDQVGDGTDVRIFLEVEGRAGLNNELAKHIVPQPLLLEPPRVRSDSSYFSSASDVEVVLNNTDGRFTGTDAFVGKEAQLWGLSNGERRLIISGIISAQSISMEELSLTISDIPIEVLEETVPKRKLEGDAYPTTQSEGATIPVVFGRAARHRCPNLSQGYATTLVASAGRTQTSILINSVAGIAKGDRIAIGLGTVNLETAKVTGVDLALKRVTFSPALENSHDAGASVTNHDNVYDYLLGEGVLTEGANTRLFQGVDKVYHDNYTLNEEVVEVSGSVTGRGEVSITLPIRLARPLAGPIELPTNQWYENFVIDLLNSSGVVLESHVIESYDRSDNSIKFERTTATTRNYDAYRLKEYRFFDGTQAYPYGSLAFIRFAVKYTSEVRADCKGFDLTNPFDVVKAVMADPNWGANSDNLSFSASDRAAINVYRMEGVLDRPLKVAQLIEEIGKFHPFKLSAPHGQAVLKLLGRGRPTKTLSSPVTDYVEPPRLEFLSVQDRVSKVKVDYRPNHRDNEFLSISSDDSSLPSAGTELEITLPYVYSKATADRVLDRAVKTAKARTQTLQLSVDVSQVLGIQIGDPLIVADGSVAPANSKWEVEAAEEVADTFIDLTLIPWVDRSYTGSDPEDDADPFNPEVDFSQEYPDKIGTVTLTTSRKISMTGEESIFIKAVWFPPGRNYSGARVYFREQSATDDAFEFAGFADNELQFEVPKAGVVYVVQVASVSEDGTLVGEPSESTITSALDTTAPDKPPKPSIGVYYRTIQAKIANYTLPDDFSHFEWETEPFTDSARTVSFEAVFRIPGSGTDEGFKARVRAVDYSGNMSEWSDFSDVVMPADVLQVEGLDGQDGQGIEYVFASSIDGTAISGDANLPDPNWNYDHPDLGKAAGLTRGNQVYYDGTPPDISEDRPFEIRFRRGVPGSPAENADIGERPWTQEKAIRQWGIKGTDGVDGRGIEYILCSSKDGLIVKDDHPDVNTAAGLPTDNDDRDRGDIFILTDGRVYEWDGEMWEDLSVDLITQAGATVIIRNLATARPATANNGSIFVSRADGVVQVYDNGSWSNEGLVFERINLPDADWNYDIDALRAEGGAKRGRYAYYDGSPPDLSADRPWQHRFRRDTPGTPPRGTDLGNVPFIQERATRAFGETGSPGPGWDPIYTAYTAATLPASKYPDNDWGYADPGTIDDQTWTTFVPDLTPEIPFLFEARRQVVGVPQAGDPVTGTWRTPALVGHYATFDIDDIGKASIPWEKIGDVQVEEGQISAPVIFANAGGFTTVAVGIADIIQLNADRINAGILDAVRLSADVKNAKYLWLTTNDDGKQAIHDSDSTTGTGFILTDDWDDYDTLEFILEWAQNQASTDWVWGNAEIPTGKIPTTRPASSNMAIGGWENHRCRAFIWRGAPGDADENTIYIKTESGGDDNPVRIYQVIGVSGPTGTSDSGGGTTGGSDDREGNQTKGITVTPSNPGVEEGGSVSVDIVLDAEPDNGQDVVLTIAESDADISIDKTTMTFTDEDWDEAQALTITGEEDADFTNDTAVINITASGGGYGSQRATINVTINDDDQRPDPVIVTLRETFYQRASSTPTGPSAQTGTPSGWSTDSTLQPTLTLAVYQVVRTTVTSDGVATSITYGNVTIQRAKLDPPDPVIRTSRITFYRRASTTPAVPTARTGTPSGWSTSSNLAATASLAVYQVTRTTVTSDGTITSVTYGSVSIQKAKLTPPPVTQPGRPSGVSARYVTGFTISASWNAVTGATAYDWETRTSAGVLGSSGSTSSTSVSGIAGAGVGAKFRVRARNTGGSSGYTEVTVTLGS